MFKEDLIKFDFRAESRNVRRSCYRYVFPPMLGMIFAQMAPVVDCICVSGSMGEEALSAIGVVAPLDYVLNIICALIGIGCGVVVSRYSGAGEKAVAARVFTRSIIALISISLILNVIGIVFMNPLLKLLCATPENMGFAKEYLFVILFGCVFMNINFAGDYILANDNNENLAVAGDIVSAVVNIIISFVGVYVFGQGIWIVAFGTVMGSVCCFLVYLLHFNKKDRLCRLVKPERKKGDPSMLEIFKPGSAEAVMYLFFAIQLIVQNFVLSKDAGTSGLGNSTVVENLTLVFTIVIAGCTDAIYPMTSAYYGEQNQSGMLIVKRILTKFGFIMLLVPIVILCVWPGLAMIPYKIDDPVMVSSLPFAIRFISLNQLLVFVDTLMIDYLSATEQEGKANLAFVIQLVVQIPMTLLLNKWFGMNSPWYASFIAQVIVLIYLCFLCGDLPKGIRRFYRKNLLILKGGKLNLDFMSEFSKAAEDVLSDKQFDILKHKMIEPIFNVLDDNTTTPYCTFTILERNDDKLGVILRYEGKKDLLDDLPEIKSDNDDENKKEEVPTDICIKSEFLGMRRIMILLGKR